MDNCDRVAFIIGSWLKITVGFIALGILFYIGIGLVMLLFEELKNLVLLVV